MNQENFPEHWKVVRLGDYIFKPEYGYTASAVKDSIGTKFLRITDIQDDSVDWKDVPYCKCDDDTKKKYLLVPGDIVIARIGATTGKTFLVNDCPESIFASYLIRVKTKSSLLSEFLSTYFRTEDYWGQIRQNKGGRLKGGVNIPILQNLKIPLPPLPEQRSIAHILQTIQEAKSTRQREIELERECKATLLDRLFSHGTKGEPRKQTEIGEIPESWEVVRLEEATEIIMGQSPKGDTYNTDGEGEPLINGPAEFGSEYPTPVQWTSKPTKLCQDGDILFCVRGNTTGRMNIANRRYCIGRGIAAIRERSSKSDTLFIRNLLEFEHSSLYRIAIGGGSTFPNITTVHLKNYLIPLPNVSEQQEIAEILQACHTKIAALEQETALLDELFHAMLDELMIGNRCAVPLIDREE